MTDAEEHATDLYSSTKEWSANSTVEAQKAIIADGLPEAVQGARVPWRQMVGLRLKSDLDSVERVLDVFTKYTCY